MAVIRTIGRFRKPFFLSKKLVLFVLSYCMFLVYLYSDNRVKRIDEGKNAETI